MRFLLLLMRDNLGKTSAAGTVGLLPIALELLDYIDVGILSALPACVVGIVAYLLINRIRPQ